MKKLEAILILLCFIVCNACAQENASANLKVELSSIQSIKINEGQSDVSINLSSSEDFINGKSTTQADHIEIMSSSQYEVQVSAESHLTSTEANIDIGTVTLTPTQGSIGGAITGSLELSPVSLSLSANTIVQSSHGDTKRTFNIEYHLSGGEAYLNKPSGIYTTVITYTIIMQ